jgi:hypothetical protein
MSINVTADATIGGTLLAAGSTTDFGPFQFQPLPLGTMVDANPFPPLDASWNGLTWKGYQSGVNAVKIRVSNVTSGGITPVSQGFKIKIVGATDPSLG